LLVTSGVDSVVAIDVHSPQIEGFFNVPMINLSSTDVFIGKIRDHFPNLNANNAVVVAPDIGGVVRAKEYAKKLNLDIAIIDKKRNAPSDSEVMNIIGNIASRDCIIIDDIIDSAVTICSAADSLMNAGAKSVTGYVTHPVLSSSAIQRIQDSKINKICISDSIPLNFHAQLSQKIEVVSLSNLIANFIRNIN
jgi:ribose-phosphate pyrophosphokinase